MKKIILILILSTLFGSLCVSAQAPAGWTKETWNEAVANKASRLILNADKDLLEASEVCNLNIQLIFVPNPDPTNETPNLFNEVTYQNLPTGEVTPYKTTNWRIVEGGGNIITENNTATYTGPNSAPKDKKMIISVDLEPQSPNLPKIQLVKTLYFTENETTFTLNVPAAGITNAKFTNVNNGGVGSISKGNVPQMAYDAAKSKGYELNALTSNAMAIYNAENQTTIIQFPNLSLEAMDGSKNIVPNMAILAFAYKGHGTGSFNWVEENKAGDVGITMALPVSQKGCGCSKDAYDNDEKFNCSGNVVITKDDGKVIEGHFNSVIFTDNGQNIVRGRLQGKFRAMKAN